jgi:cytochrome c oxidase assembly protein subunit 15
MTLDEFRFIYGWEYGHRMLGRFVELLLPWIAFTLRGKIKGQGRMLGLLAKEALRNGGMVMVKSAWAMIDELKKRGVRPFD